MGTTSFYHVERLAQLRALQSPLRVQLVAVLRNLGQASVRQLADQMDTRPEGLHYHVRQLVAVGLVDRVGKRRVSRRMESVYALPGKDLKIDLDGRRPAYRSEVGRVYSAALRLADRTMLRALAARPVSGGTTAEAPRLIQIGARLRKRPMKELRRKLAELERFLREHDDPRASHMYLLTVACSEKPSSRRGGDRR